MHHTLWADLGKGLECEPLEPREKPVRQVGSSGWRCLCPAAFGGCALRERDSSSTGPGSQGAEQTQPTILHSPQDRWRQGGHRTVRTLLPLGTLQAVQISALPLALGASGQGDWETVSC